MGRIVALETNFKHITDTVEKIDNNVNKMMTDHLPHLKENIGTEEEPEKVLVWRDWETDQE